MEKGLMSFFILFALLAHPYSLNADYRYVQAPGENTTTAAVKGATISTSPDLRFRHLTIDDGLSQNFISCIHQDHLGFIWIGTKDGLNMYNGYDFTIFKHYPFNPNTISDNFIKAIYNDSKGRLWVGTLNGGLNLYDRHSEKFTRFVHNPADMNSISHNNVQSITEDEHGNIWIGTSGGGINRLSFKDSGLMPSTAETIITRYVDTISGFSMHNAEIRSLFVDRNNTLWIGTTRNILSAKLSDDTPVFHRVPLTLDTGLSRPDDLVAGGRVIFEDTEGLIWMGNGMGLFHYDNEMQAFIEYKLPDTSISLKGLITAATFQNKETSELWVSREYELLIIDAASGRHRTLVYNKDKPEGLQKGLITTLFVDQSGTIWIGSNGFGLSVFDPFSMKFNYPDEVFTDNNGLRTSTRDLSIRSFYETYGEENFLWIGANEGFYRINRRTGALNAISLPVAPEGEYLIVFSIQGDNDGHLWLGTNCGLIRYHPQSGSAGVFPTNLNGMGQTGEPRVTKVFIDGEDIWAITPNTIACFNREREELEHLYYNNEPYNQYIEPVFPCLLSDNNGNFWMGNNKGLHYFDRQKQQLTSYTNNPADTNSLSFNDVRAIVADPTHPDEYLWLATGGNGLSRFDLKNHTFKSYNEHQGLSNNMVYGILNDVTGNLWASTNKGLSRFNIKNETFTNYNIDDGLQSNEFNAGAFYKSRQGEMFFGGIRGYNSFFPAQVMEKQFLAPLVITAFKILSGLREIPEGTNFSNTAHPARVNLKHNQNHLLVEFSSLDFASPEGNSYSYSLTTSGERWINIGSSRSITLTDMKPGMYTLKIRGTNNDGVWSNKMALLQIDIQQPWWKQTSAIIIYFILFMGAIAALRQYELSRIRLKNQMKHANLEAEKLKELDVLKSQLFANISHEFRTPLTLIKGPVEQLLEDNNDSEKLKILRVLHTNTERLQELIDQLLDLSRLENGQYRVSAACGDIVTLIKGLVMSFNSICEQKQITLKFTEAVALKKNISLRENFYFDRDIMEKIINNLVSNAVKFTPAQGKITISVCLHRRSNGREEFEITIKDTGIGIPRDKLPLIYDRFFQVDPSSKREHPGTGIGLAYVKELMEVHQGKIAVMSKPGKGTTFRLRFPMGKDHFAPGQIITPDELIKLLPLVNINSRADTPVVKSAVIAGAKDTDKDLVLVVEDNHDVRKYICDGLKICYHLMEASTAIEGFKKAQEFIPDLIISDVMMPGMDGFEFCGKIKSDIKTSHIPVILLTARSSETDRIHGLETGADDYMIKPFNSRELLVRVKNLIESRNILHRKFNSNIVMKPGEISVSSRDRVFMEKLLKIVESHISDEQFSVEELARETAMSTSQLHRKLKALVNQSPIRFIRMVRMNRAKELLEKDAGNIAEIAYMVGYSDPGYFSKTYRSLFGILPSGVKKNDHHSDS